MVARSKSVKKDKMKRVKEMGRKKVKVLSVGHQTITTMLSTWVREPLIDRPENQDIVSSAELKLTTLAG